MPTKFGQNFLANEGIAKEIARASHAKIGDEILEIGPGKGMLTKYLARSEAQVTAVELDRDLTEPLKKTFAEQKYVEIIEGDILKINLPQVLSERNISSYKVVANIPYYITQPIIRFFLEAPRPPSEMILMVQKEVAERIIAKDGKESLLSISVKFYADPEILFFVSRDNFEPVPKVDSAVIRINRKKNIPNIDRIKFFSLVRAGYSAKRKKLANNLSAMNKVGKKEMEIKLNEIGLGVNVRAQELTLSDWLKLYENWID